MLYRPLFVRIKGLIPQIMHNGILKDPLGCWPKQLGKYSKKRKKTDDDHVAMMECEFKGSLYLYDEDSDPKKHPYNGEHPYWPADNIHACIKTAAKLKKLGKDFDSAVIVMPPGGRLIYKGPTTRNGLWEDQRFRFIKPTRRGVMSCRPCFNDWEVEFQLRVFENRLNVEDVEALIVDAGAMIGLSEWPRRHGLFEVVSIQEKEAKIDVTKHK